MFAYICSKSDVIIGGDTYPAGTAQAAPDLVQNQPPMQSAAPYLRAAPYKAAPSQFSRLWMLSKTMLYAI